VLKILDMIRYDRWSPYVIALPLPETSRVQMAAIV
jgi:hypothetical protein